MCVFIFQSEFKLVNLLGMLILFAVIAAIVARFLILERRKKRRLRELKAAREQAKREHQRLLTEYKESWAHGNTDEIVIAAYAIIDSELVTRRELKDIYRDALSLLPKNPRLKEYALRLGRSYYSNGRQDGAPTMYDELAISNDIMAASSV